MTEMYWNSRGKNSITYRGENFYTITPLPYYYRRRKCICNFIKTLLDEYTYSVCDYGCGDGYYSAMIKKCKSDVSIDAYDISEEMLSEAKNRYSNIPDINFYRTNGCGSDLKDEKYDLVIIVAVLAHINDDEIYQILKNIYRSLKNDGKLYVCEQIGKKHVTGKTYKRRTTEEYTNLFLKSGFVIKKYRRIDYWIHRIIMERHIAKIFYNKIHGDNDVEIRIKANKNPAFIFLSELFSLISIPHLFNSPNNGWGYGEFCLRKK